ncbi:MAG: 50S ribosomal protein L23 [Phycisphaeraceae bacterium]
MHATTVIKRPLITEKSTWEAASRNRYAFVVALHADKAAIKEAVAALYNVRVVKVATQVRKGEYRKTKFGETKTPDWKRATVELHPDDKIELI